MATTTTRPHHLYRRLLRAYVNSSIQPRPSRSTSITTSLRQLFSPLPSSASAQKGKGKLGMTEAQVQSWEVYLKANRLHLELVKRYNPSSDLTEPERIKATANRVGLNVPRELDLDTPLPTGKRGDETA